MDPQVHDHAARISGVDTFHVILHYLHRAALIHGVRQPLAAFSVALLAARRSAARAFVVVCMLGENTQRAQASNVTPIVATLAAAPPFEVRMQSTHVATARGSAISPVKIFVAAAIALCQLRGRAFGVRDGHVCGASAGRQQKKRKCVEKETAHSPTAG